MGLRRGGGIQLPQKSDAVGKAQSAANIGFGVARAFGGDPSGALQAVGGAKSLSGQQQGPQPVQGAISRKNAGAQIPLEDRIKVLQTAEAVLPSLPKEVNDEVGPVIFNAMVQTANEIKSTGYQPQGQAAGQAFQPAQLQPRQL